MNGTILVPLKKLNELENVMPYVDSVAKPGMKVLFLLRTRAGNWPALQAHLTAMETGHFTSLDTYDLSWRERMAQEKRRAEEKLAEKTASRFTGIYTEVMIYRGSLKKALARLAMDGSPQMIVVPTRRLFPNARIIRSALSAMGFPKRETLPPVLLHHYETMRG